MDIGIVGLGVMGRPMASHLMKKGHRLHVYARRPEAAADVVAGGAVMHATPSELASHSEVVITMVTTSSDVEAVLIGERGVVEGARAGTCGDRHEHDLPRGNEADRIDAPTP